MKLTQIEESVFVSGQITIGDLQDIVEQGIKTILCNRPDGEEVDQPSYAEINDAAAALGLKSAYIPVSPRGLTQENIDAFADALGNAPKPILAYCRTGNRSAVLFQAAR
ncbi:oxidoreductase [Amylibacter marinus]|uniref:Oxidoreductase n=1 Tax=Amylibacter marinus TaxID=1475483 RepID=A0ABQ5VXS2_9RHOB|nr:TIGR01244 family sulfur transferase [Amylibacter marinus]GLQ36150.1 oxidoreductase [Amylibacter marinus]